MIERTEHPFHGAPGDAGHSFLTLATDHSDRHVPRKPIFARSRLAIALLLGAVLVLPQVALSGPPPLPAFPQPVRRTNAPSRAVPPPSVGRLNTRTNAAVAAPRKGATAPTNAVTKAATTNASAGGVLDSVKQLAQNRGFYVVIGVVILLGVLLLVRAFRPAKAARTAGSVPATVPSKAMARPAKRKAKVAIHSCNVLDIRPQARQVWQFDAHGNRCQLSREHTALEGEALPSSMVAKDWRSLFQHKLNIAWLPADQVFLRAAQFPRSDFDETLSMVELQLEKLSPMPVAQIVWSIQVLPHAEGNLQTVIVMIMARSVVEEFLGQLEGQGYLADRLELPMIDQLQSTAITEDGAWIYPELSGNAKRALVAWWYGGVLRNLDLLSLPEANAGDALKEQLMQMAWAGELEGWLTSPPEWHLVADVAVPEWETALRQGLEQPIELVAPLPTTELAALTARRAANAEPRATLMPEEYAVRYQQQFVDRLWMRALLAAAGLYAVGVMIYMGVLGYATWRTSNVEGEVAALGPAFTNAQSILARYKVLNERKDLKFAGLECWSVAARYLPENATVDSLGFSQGKRLALSGTAPADYMKAMLDFEAAMRKANGIDGQPLFDLTKGENLTWRMQGANASWSLVLELKRSEVE